MSEIATERNGKKINKKERRGMALIYGIATMSAMCGLASLATDYGRVQMTKVELRQAAVAAARAGAAGLSTSSATAISNATIFAEKNTANGLPVVIDASQDIELGVWQNATFTKIGANSKRTPNAVHVTLHCSQARGNGVPLLFGKVLGANFCDATGDSIAEFVPGTPVQQNVQATANPFLAGVAAGKTASAINPSSRHIPDVAGDSSNQMNSPQAVAMQLSTNAPLTFAAISGTAQHDPSLPSYEPDGQTGDTADKAKADIGHNNLTTDYDNDYNADLPLNERNENGMADMTAPIDALVGVFLDDNDPSESTTPAPANKDFSTADSRNFSTLQPQLRQIFFIGDGLMNDGKTAQTFVPPAGATRLFLATWDFYEWNNNSGNRVVQITRPSAIITVK